MFRATRRLLLLDWAHSSALALGQFAMQSQSGGIPGDTTRDQNGPGFGGGGVPSLRVSAFNEVKSAMRSRGKPLPRLSPQALLPLSANNKNRRDIFLGREGVLGVICLWTGIYKIADGLYKSWAVEGAGHEGDVSDLLGLTVPGYFIYSAWLLYVWGDDSWYN